MGVSRDCAVVIRLGDYRSTRVDTMPIRRSRHSDLRIVAVWTDPLSAHVRVGVAPRRGKPEEWQEFTDSPRPWGSDLVGLDPRETQMQAVSKGPNIEQPAFLTRSVSTRFAPVRTVLVFDDR